jgi:hypothetical protein
MNIESKSNLNYKPNMELSRPNVRQYLKTSNIPINSQNDYGTCTSFASMKFFMAFFIKKIKIIKLLSITIPDDFNIDNDVLLGSILYKMKDGRPFISEQNLRRIIDVMPNVKSKRVYNWSHKTSTDNEDGDALIMINQLLDEYQNNNDISKTYVFLLLAIYISYIAIGKETGKIESDNWIESDNSHILREGLYTVIKILCYRYNDKLDTIFQLLPSYIYNKVRDFFIFIDDNFPEEIVPLPIMIDMFPTLPDFYSLRAYNFLKDFEMEDVIKDIDDIHKILCLMAGIQQMPILFNSILSDWLIDDDEDDEDEDIGHSMLISSISKCNKLDKDKDTISNAIILNSWDNNVTNLRVNLKNLLKMFTTKLTYPVRFQGILFTCNQQFVTKTSCPDDIYFMQFPDNTSYASDYMEGEKSNVYDNVIWPEYLRKYNKIKDIQNNKSLSAKNKKRRIRRITKGIPLEYPEIPRYPLLKILMQYYYIYIDIENERHENTAIVFNTPKIQRPLKEHEKSVLIRESEKLHTKTKIGKKRFNKRKTKKQII